MVLTKLVFGLKHLTKNQAAFELTFAGILWGFGFVAAVWALEAFTPVEILVYRFILATLLGEVIYLVVRGPSFASAKEDFFRALPAGALLGSMLLLQTIGLKYTTATKSGFLTSLYVILVPIINAWFFKSASSWKNYALAGLALLGTFVLMNANLNGMNVGDLWTLGCSVIAAFHIIYIGRISDRVGNAFRFNNFQSFWCLVVLAPLLLWQDKVHFETQRWDPWAGVIILGAASSVIAFYLQIRSQKILLDSTASMLFLLESPFAALFGFWLLQERLSLFQLSGAVIILISAILQILWAPATKTTETKPK